MDSWIPKHTPEPKKRWVSGLGLGLGFYPRLNYEEEIKAKSFVVCLIFHLKRKFNQELNSVVYYSAAILNVSKLSGWINRVFSVEYVKKALKTLSETVAISKKCK